MIERKLIALISNKLHIPADGLNVSQFHYSSLRKNSHRKYYVIRVNRLNQYFGKIVSITDQNMIVRERNALKMINNKMCGISPVPILYSSALNLLVVSYIEGVEGDMLLNRPLESDYIYHAIISLIEFHKGSCNKHVNISCAKSMVNMYNQHGIYSCEFTNAIVNSTYGFTHGDYNPKNTMYNYKNKQCIIIDFEDFQRTSIVALDFLYFINMYAIFKFKHLSHNEVYDRIFSLQTDFMKQIVDVLDVYASGVGLRPMEILYLFPACWLYHIERLEKQKRQLNGFCYPLFLERFRKDISSGKIDNALAKMIQAR